MKKQNGKVKQLLLYHTKSGRSGIRNQEIFPHSLYYSTYQTTMKQPFSPTYSAPYCQGFEERGILLAGVYINIIEGNLATLKIFTCALSQGCLNYRTIVVMIMMETIYVSINSRLVKIIRLKNNGIHAAIKKRPLYVLVSNNSVCVCAYYCGFKKNVKIL